jgi:hypothetical protein
MAGTVVTDIVFFNGATATVSNCDSDVDWDGGPDEDPEVYVQGIGSLSDRISKTTKTYMYTLASAVDLTDKLLFVWMKCITPNVLQTLANGGMRIRIEDALSNWAEWYVAGSDTHNGNWAPFVIRTNQSTNRHESVTPPTYSAITKVGVGCTTTDSISKNNFWWDALRYGTKMQVYGGTSGSPATFDDLVAAEASNRYGAFNERGGIIYAQSKIEIGSTALGVDTYFKDTNKVIVFEDQIVGNFYDIKLQGNSTGNTQIYFGEKLAGRGISGCVFRSSGTPKFTITATDVNIDNLGIYDCRFYDSGIIYLPNSSVNKEVLDTSFEVCAEVIANLCKVQYCNFINPDDRGLKISSASHNVSDCNFINCAHGVHFDISATINITNFLFSGSDGSTRYDIEHSVSGSLILNALERSNPSASYVDETGGGSTSINYLKTLKITVTNSFGLAIQGIKVRIENDPIGTIITEGVTDGAGEYIDETYNYSGDEDCKIIARLKGYKNNAAFSTITEKGLTVPFTMMSDDAVNLP